MSIKFNYRQFLSFDELSKLEGNPLEGNFRLLNAKIDLNNDDPTILYIKMVGYFQNKEEAWEISYAYMSLNYNKDGVVKFSNYNIIDKTNFPQFKDNQREFPLGAYIDLITKNFDMYIVTQNSFQKYKLDKDLFPELVKYKRTKIQENEPVLVQITYQFNKSLAFMTTSNYNPRVVRDIHMLSENELEYNVLPFEGGRLLAEIQGTKVLVFSETDFFVHQVQPSSKLIIKADLTTDPSIILNANVKFDTEKKA